MTTYYPFLEISLNKAGNRSGKRLSVEPENYPLALWEKSMGMDGNLTQQQKERLNVSTSINVVVTEAIMELLRDGERLYVNPVKKGHKTLAPSVVFLPESKMLNPFISKNYKPIGASWKSEKGYRIGIFFLHERGTAINKDHFDFIAVIDPGIFFIELNEIWENGDFPNLLDALKSILVSKNRSAYWVKWQVNYNHQKNVTSNGNFERDYYFRDEVQCNKLRSNAIVIGLDGNESGETIFILQTLVGQVQGEYQLVKSLGVILLLDNTGDYVPDTHPNFNYLLKACITGVREFIRDNPWMGQLVRFHDSSIKG